MVRKNAYLLGGNGAPNFGDELIAKAWLDYLSERSPEARITLDCNSINTPRTFFGLDGDRVQNLSGIKIFANTTIKTQFAGIKNAGERFLTGVRHGLDFFSNGTYAEFPQLREALEAIEDSATFHIFGGGYINSGIRPDSGFLIGFAAAVKRQFGAKIFATGIGLTPLHFDARENTAPLAEALSEFALFECRDVYGYDKLFNLLNNRANLVNGVDDTYMVRYVSGVEENTPRRLHLCFLRQEFGPELQGLQAEILAIAPAFDEVTYWNCVPNFADRNLDNLRRALPDMRVLDCHQLVFQPLPVGPNDYMVTQRFHPHLIAARLGCSGVFVQDGLYYNDKHRSVVHLGSSFKKYVPGMIDGTPSVRPARILERDAENMDRKRQVRDFCYENA
ncbi:polysaccharide pyruvyl transferase family protein [Rubellimicrobium rubrum]|uniref:Polysaccharide pyruvyl transferase family protein n=1 Tax=Rubellimicrobium rubrum TaxID=2585369 RepID=A0A5C4MJ47_9RHOB|nr:polysaccharide pyruvyl transferase family protein [Rubellimicrobium rubrum]TNC44204.1 polysaccharide pyruvyl transferase family protein [Rubellimicrobium rubrum]